jgi:hypothetical protein
MEEIKKPPLEEDLVKRNRYISFIKILRQLDLYQSSYIEEDMYWDFVEALGDKHRRR